MRGRAPGFWHADEASGHVLVMCRHCGAMRLRQGLPVRAWLRAVACPGKAAQTAGYIARRAGARQIKCTMVSGYRAIGLRVCKTKCRQPYTSLADYPAMGLRVCMTKCAVLSRPGLACAQSHTHGLRRHAICVDSGQACELHLCVAWLLHNADAAGIACGFAFAAERQSRGPGYSVLAGLKALTGSRVAYVAQILRHRLPMIVQNGKTLWQTLDKSGRAIYNVIALNISADHPRPLAGG